MYKRVLSVVLFILLAFAFLSCSRIETKVTLTGHETKSIETNNADENILISDAIRPVKIKDDLIFVDESVYNFYNYVEPEPVDYSESKVKDYFVKTFNGQIKTEFCWEISDKELLKNIDSYQVRLSTSQDFDTDKTILYTILSKRTKHSVGDLKAGTSYYWDVTAVLKSGDKLRSTVSTFSTSPNQPRFISSDNVKNIRDIGGKKTLNGNYTIQGLAYRSSQFDNEGRKLLALSESKYFVETLKIKSEIDLRSPAESSGAISSAISDSIKYHLISVSPYVRNTLNDNVSNTMAQAIKMFSDFDNYPLVFHCKGGVDRTGTLATIIELLSGVSEQAAVRDYEISTFQYSPKYRNNTFLEGQDPLEYAKYMGIVNSYSGKTITEKMQNMCHDFYKLTWQEIDNIGGIFTDNDFIYSNKSLEKVAVNSGKVQVGILLRDSVGIDKIKINGNEISFDAKQNDGTLNVEFKIPELSSGTYIAEFCSGNTVRRLEFTV